MTKQFDLKTALEHYRAQSEAEKQFQIRCRELLANEPKCFHRYTFPGHFTASACVANEAHTHMLLAHHRKLGIWCQPGGHADGEANLLNVALRELLEEAGLDLSRDASGAIFDLDIHTIPARKSEPEHLHYDVRFLFRTGELEKPVVSEESFDVRWIQISELPALKTDFSVRRMAEKLLIAGADTKSSF